jgi:signal transduction histidine kinase
MRRPFALILAFLALAFSQAGWAAPAAGGSEAGLPFIHNFAPRRDLRAHPQNWTFVQDLRGVLYVGNGEGVLEFDGVRWRLIPVANGSAVRSLACAPDGRIYVGAENELGYLAPDADGTRQYVSLKPQVDRAGLHASIVRAVHMLARGPVFMTKEGLIEVQAGGVAVWPQAQPILRSFALGGSLLLQLADGSLLRWEAGRSSPVPGTGALAGQQLRAVLPDPAGKAVLLCTLSQGLFRMDEHGILPFPTEADGLFRTRQIAAGLRTKEGALVFALGGGGVAALDVDGHLTQRLDMDAGLRDDTVRSLFQDRDGRLWLGFNNGLAHLEWPSPFSLHDARTGLRSMAWAVARHQGALYASTADGVYRLDPTGAAGAVAGTFHPVAGVHGMCLGLVSTGPSLLVANAPQGVYEILGDGARLVWATNRNPTFLVVPEGRGDRVLVATERGMAVLERRQGSWTFAGDVAGLDGQVVSAVETRPGEFWFGTRSRGVIHATFQPGGLDLAPALQTFGTAQGLPTDTLVGLARIQGRLLAGTPRGLYALDEGQGRFVQDPGLAALFPGETRAVDVLRPGLGGSLWAYSRNDALRIREAGVAVPGPAGAWTWQAGPFRRCSESGMADILQDPDGVVWFCTTDGVVRFDPRLVSPGRGAAPALIRKVVGAGNRVLFGGGTESAAWPAPELPFRNGFLRFEFATPSFDVEGSNAYQVRLDGRDAAWSPWLREAFKEYTALPEGDYCFRVRAQDVYGQVSPEQTFRFRIHPPWYRTWTFRVAFALLALLAVGQFLALRTRILRRRNALLQSRIAEATRELQERNREMERQASVLARMNDELLGLNARLSELDRQKTHFLGVAAHDLRSPLNGIVLTAELLEEETDPAEIRLRARAIRSEGLRMSNLLGRFLDISAIESGVIKPEPEAFPLGEAVGKVVLEHQPQAGKKGITLTFQGASEDHAVFADLRFSREILENLISNALKFSPPDSAVTVKVGWKEDWGYVTVTDQGPGLTPKDRENLFGRFVKLSARPTAGESSSGLGLNIVKHMADAMDCRIQVDCEPGRGATFQVEFPLPRGEAWAGA